VLTALATELSTERIAGIVSSCLGIYLYTYRVGGLEGYGDRLKAIQAQTEVPKEKKKKQSSIALPERNTGILPQFICTHVI
jgi:hypothetical protein